MNRAASATRARSPWGWMSVGLLLGAALSVLAFAPAHWLAAALERASAGRVQLLDARGTVWNGSALLTLTGGAGSVDRSSLPGRMAWQLALDMAEAGASGWPQPALSIRAPCCTSKPLDFRLTPGWGGVQVSLAGADLRLPAAWLNGLGTPFNTLQLGGTLALSTPGLQMDVVAGRVRVQGEAELIVANAVSSLSTLKPLGTYRLQMFGGDTPRLSLRTMDGALRLQGDGQIVGARLRFDGVASAAPSFEDALGNLLNIIGRRDGARSIISMS